MHSLSSAATVRSALFFVRALAAAARTVRRCKKGAALCLLAAACGSGSGGLGIGFGPDTASIAQASAPPVHIGRVFLPTGSAVPPYIELINDGPEALDWTLSPLKLVSAQGEAQLPSAGDLAAGASVALDPAELAPLLLEADVGELLLMRSDLTPLGYVAWGLDPNAPRTGLGNIAERAGAQAVGEGGVPVSFAYPLPAPRSNAQALLFGQGDQATSWCADANIGISEPAPTACLQGP